MCWVSPRSEDCHGVITTAGGPDVGYGHVSVWIGRQEGVGDLKHDDDGVPGDEQILDRVFDAVVGEGQGT